MLTMGKSLYKHCLIETLGGRKYERGRCIINEENGDEKP